MTWLTNTFNRAWSTEQTPGDFRKGIILPFWKRKGDALTCSNYRDISRSSQYLAKHLSGSTSTERSPPCINTADPTRQASCPDDQQRITSPLDCSLKRPENSENTVHDSIAVIDLPHLTRKTAIAYGTFSTPSAFHPRLCES